MLAVWNFSTARPAKSAGASPDPNFRQWPATLQTYRIVAGPDLNGDGCRELFTASYDRRSGHVYVDALSGADGRILWSNQQIKVFHSSARLLLPMRWWQAGSDGWPLLVVGTIVFGANKRKLEKDASQRRYCRLDGPDRTP